MPYDPTAYREIRDAFTLHVRTIFWRNPDAKLGIACRPASHPKGAGLATFDVDDRASVTDGFEVAHAGPIPNCDDVRLAAWIQEVTRWLPILPGEGPITEWRPHCPRPRVAA